MTPLQTLIYECIRYSDWAAGSSGYPIDSSLAGSPEEFLMDYSDATDDENWETLAARIAAAIPADLVVPA